jgi:transposase
MIFPSNRVRVMVATKPVDFRKGHDGLAALVKNELHKDPFTGTVFVFRSRKAQLPTFCIRFSLFDDCLSLAPAVREEGAGLAVQAWQEFNLHLHG